MLPNFFYHPRMMRYDFGANHPLKPERLQRTMDLLAAVTDFQAIDPGTGEADDLLRVHSADYVDAVRRLSEIPPLEWNEDLKVEAYPWGFATLDNPPFPGMYEASLAYVAGSAGAAQAVCDGAPLAYGIAGGLHHALRDKASGFCIFNDCAIACHILRERFPRVAYVDIDVHHGDGVQWIFYEDASILTCSIHEDPRSLWPGTGAVEETGADYSALNVPLPARTTGDTWIQAFKDTIIPLLQRFEPGAIVLQMGTDTHFLDPLAHLQNTAQDWLEAVRTVRDLGIPVVALGGGGYNLATVPRMWVAACLTLAGQSVPDDIPEPLASRWGVASFFDAHPPGPAGLGGDQAGRVVDYVREHHLATS